MEIQVSLLEIKHFGGDLKKQEFFVEAPIEIGDLIYGHSDFKNDEKPISPKKRVKSTLFYTLKALIIANVIAFILIYFNNDFSTVKTFLIWNFLFFALGILIGYFSTVYIKKCSYLGTNGYAKYSLNQKLEINKEIFLFEDAHFLFKNVTDIYKNSFYSTTEYYFHFINESDNIVKFALGGSYNKNVSDLSFIEANVIEIEWSKYILPKIFSEINKKGFATFRFKNSDSYLKIYNNKISYNEDFQFTKEEVRSWRIKEGVLSIYEDTKKPGLFSKTGKSLNLPLSLVANQRVLLVLLQENFGIRLS